MKKTSPGRAGLCGWCVCAARGVRRSVAVPDEQHDHRDRDDDDRGRSTVLAVLAPADRTVVLRGDGAADDVRGCADRGRAAADVGTHGQCPCQRGEVEAFDHGEVLDDWDHGRCERDVVDERTGDRGYPEDDRDGDQQVAAADLRNEVRDEFEDACLLEAADDDKEADEEQQGLVVHASHDVLERLRVDDRGDDGDADTDGGNGEAGLCVGDEQDDCDREDDDAGEEVALALDDFIRFRILEQGRVFDFAADLLVHDDVEVDQREDKTDACDRTGVGDEVAERVVQRGADDDVRRVTAHGGRAAEVGAEDFCDDHRTRIEPQESGQLDGGAGQEQDDRDAVDEHRQRRGQGHECDEDLDRVVFDGLGEGQAEPFEEACVSHAFDHDHHATDEQDRGPVDAARFFGGFVCRIPE